MRVTTFTRRALAFRKQRRDLERQGYEELSENGAPLWELHRGGRFAHRITDVIIGVDGKTLYLKIEKEQQNAP